MSIVYIDTKNYTSNDLQELFQSVGWLSANYPERLKKALGNSETVFTVWDGEKLVGLVNAIDDSELTAYVHYLCVNPEYQGQGIGKNLLQRIKEKYKNYHDKFNGIDDGHASQKVIDVIKKVSR